MKKSKRLTNRELIGKKILGKYIFFRILALLTTLLEVVVTALPKRFHSITPESTNNGYGILTSPNVTLIAKLKITNTAVIAMGWIKAHKKPKTACLYFILISFHAKK